MRDGENDQGPVSDGESEKQSDLGPVRDSERCGE